MTGKDLALINPWAREEAISRLRRCPVLTGKGNAATDLPRKLLDQGAEPLSVTDILKLAARNLAFQPTPDLLIQRLHARSPSDSKEINSDTLEPDRRYTGLVVGN